MVHRDKLAARRMLVKIVLQVLLFANAAMLATEPGQARTVKTPAGLTWQPAKLVRGSPVLFQVSAPKAQTITGEWMGHKITFFRYENGTSWYALAGIPVETKPGSYELSYDRNGNLVRPGVTYDDKINIYRTNRVWQFINGDYSRNNPVTGGGFYSFPVTPAAYNGAGLPTRFLGPSTLIFGYSFYTMDVTYSCDVPAEATA